MSNNLPEHWEEKKFENCIENIKYTKKINKKKFFEKGNYPIVSQEQDYINGYWNNPGDIFKVDKPIIIFGDHTKVIKYIDFDFVLGADGVKIFKTINEIEPKYFYYFLQNLDLDNLGYARHFKLLKEKSVSYPRTLSEQKRIVKILDETFESIETVKTNIEKNLKNVQELLKSELSEIFLHKGEGRTKKKLGDIGKVCMCKRILKHQTTPEGDIPFFKIGTFGKTPNAFIPVDTFNEYRRKYSFPKKGDILISASGTIGRRVRYDGEPAYFQDSNIVWIDNNEEFVLNDFLYHFYGICNWNPSKGATIYRLYNDDLRRIKINFPSIIKQKEIVDKIEALLVKTNQLKKIYQKKLNDLEELKKSILKKAFNGELK